MQLYKSGDCREKSIPPFEAQFSTVEGKLMLFNIIEKKSKESSTNLRNKLQFVTSMKRLVFDLNENTIPPTFNQYTSFNS